MQQGLLLRPLLQGAISGFSTIPGQCLLTCTRFFSWTVFFSSSQLTIYRGPKCFVTPHRYNTDSEKQRVLLTAATSPEHCVHSHLRSCPAFPAPLAKETFLAPLCISVPQSQLICSQSHIQGFIISGPSIVFS